MEEGKDLQPVNAASTTSVVPAGASETAPPSSDLSDFVMA
jgi:hypothetical protein